MTTQMHKEAIDILELLTKGKNPLTQERVATTHFLNDPLVMEPLAYLLGRMQQEKSSKLAKGFVIPSDFVVRLPDWKGSLIGVSEFCRHVNAMTRPLGSKHLTTKHLFDKLKGLGILSEEYAEDGTKRTIVNETSEAYGISTVERKFHGRHYAQIVFDDQGVQLLTKLVTELASPRITSPK